MYGFDELVTAAGVPAELVRGLEQVGLLRDRNDRPDAYDADDVDVLRSFADLRSLGVPENVLFELARILNDAIDSVQRQTAAVFHGEQGPDWGQGIREQFEPGTANESARVVRDMRDRRLRAAPQHPTLRAPRARRALHRRRAGRRGRPRPTT